MTRLHFFWGFALLGGLLAGCSKQEEDDSSHTDPVKLADYLYEITYSDYNSSQSTDYALTMERFSVGGACSAVHNGDFIGRNYDYLYADISEFVIRTTATADRYATIGIAGSIFDLTPENTENDPHGQYFDVLPYTTVDGINEKGVFCDINMVSGETKYSTTGTNPGADETLYYTQVVRYVLDHCSSATQAVKELEKKNIVFSGILGEFHYMIADRNDTYVVEIYDNKFICKKPKDNILTNFYVLTDKFMNEDNPGTCPMGIERYDLIKEHYSELTSMDAMTRMMELVKYSRIYDMSNVPYFYSEYYGEEYNGMTLDINTPKEDYVEYIEDYCKQGKEKVRSYLDDMWITTHTSIYDMKNLKLRVYAQENFDQPFEFSL